MDRVFIYTDGIAKQNLVVPIVCAAVHIPKDFKYENPTDRNVYRITNKTKKLLKSQWDRLNIRYNIAFNDEVNKYGVNGTAKRLEKRTLIFMKAYLYLADIEEYEVIKIKDLAKSVPEAKLAYAVSKFIRDEWFYRYKLSYPELELEKYNGTSSTEHIEFIETYCRLPSFYIWYRALRLARKLCPVPPWAEQEIQKYNQLTGEPKHGCSK